jgi:RimJ/RimL family protein N-acetyltransferase
LTPVWARLPGAKDAVVRFVGAMIPGGNRGFGECVALAVLADDGRMVSGVLFHNWNPEHGVIEMSAASVEKRWLTRPVLWAMFNYAFNDAGCQLVVMRVSERNRMENGRGIQRILKAYGFEEYRIPRLQGRDTAELIYTLADDVWRAKETH